MKTIYHNTYWNNRGKNGSLHKKVAALVPAVGEVPNADAHPHLERFRVASNCYYDLYNNGLCNRADEFAEVFGFAVPIDEETGYSEKLTKATVNKVERKMNQFLIAAAKEQGINA